MSEKIDERCIHDLPTDTCGDCSTLPRVLTIRRAERAEVVTKQRRADRRDMLDGLDHSQWGPAFPANYPGNCAICGDRFGSGAHVRRFLSATGGQYAEDDCVRNEG